MSFLKGKCIVIKRGTAQEILLLGEMPQSGKRVAVFAKEHVPYERNGKDEKH